MFSISFQGLRDEVDRFSNLVTLVMQKTCFDGFRKILMESPRDTGLFVSSWMIGPEGVEKEPDIQITSGEDSEARAVGIQRLDAVLTFELGDNFQLYNNTEYGVYINYGNPKRMVTSMVEGNAMIIENKINEAFRAI